MHLTVSQCKHCGSFFEGNQEHCPSCGKRSPYGARHLLLKWLSVLISLGALAVIGYALTHSQGGN